MAVNEDNKYIAVIMRHDMERGAYSYSLVGAAKTMALKSIITPEVWILEIAEKAK